MDCVYKSETQKACVCLLFLVQQQEPLGLTLAHEAKGELIICVTSDLEHNFRSHVHHPCACVCVCRWL